MERSAKTDSERPYSAGNTTIAVLSAGIDGINQAVRALYSYKGVATYKDLATGAGLHPVYMSQSLSASRDAGLTELAGKRGLYKLTAKGDEYARFLSYGEDERAKSVLKEILLTNPAWAEIIKFLKLSYKQERNSLSLVGDIEAKLGKHWAMSVRGTYASSYVSVLRYVGFVVSSGDKIISQLSPTEDLKNTYASPSNEVYAASEKVDSPSSSLSSPQVPAGYSEFSIPEEFRIFVRKNMQSLLFFESQIKENSIFRPWIENEKTKIAKANTTVSLEISETEKG